MILPTATGLRNPDVVANYWRIVETQRATLAALVPTGLAAAAEAPSKGRDLSSLRLFATGASVCPPEIEKRFLAVWPGDCVRQVYGMTEFAGAITQTPWNRGQRPGSVGLPAALVEVAVLSGGTIHRGPSPDGEILARGPQMFAGYLDKGQQGATLYQGWLRSGARALGIPQRLGLDDAFVRRQAEPLTDFQHHRPGDAGQHAATRGHGADVVLINPEQIAARRLGDFAVRVDEQCLVRALFHGLPAGHDMGELVQGLEG